MKKLPSSSKPSLSFSSKTLQRKAIGDNASTIEEKKSEVAEEEKEVVREGPLKKRTAAEANAVPIEIQAPLKRPKVAEDDSSKEVWNS